MPWSEEQIADHIENGKTISEIMQKTFEAIGRRSLQDEFSVREFILEQFKDKNIVSDYDPPTVAFNKNTANITYAVSEESSQRLVPDTLILIDMWARKKRKGSTFADITWMAYYGESVKKKYQNTFEILLSARKNAINYIEKCLARKTMPIASEIDCRIKEALLKHNVDQYFLHATGHPLGFVTCHGRRKWICKSNHLPLEVNLPYSLEPGVYFKGDYGMRSELNFYIDEKFSLHFTTEIQDKIVLIK